VSVEAFVVTALVEDGTPKRAFQLGLQSDDFAVYEEEWEWICEQASLRKPINRRRFCLKFPEFEYVVADEKLQDLIEDFKQERGFETTASAIEEVGKNLTTDNVLEQAEILREAVSQVFRIHSRSSHVDLSVDYGDYMERVKQRRIMHGAGQTMGISTGLKNLDHHWGGLVHGRLILILGRPGDAKSFLQAKMLTEAFWEGHRVAMFSPEMNEDEHRARIATLLSAKPEVQEALGLKNAFRNRALMEGHSFNIKTYKRFWQFLESECKGRMILLTRQWHRQKMTPAFIESKIDDLGVEIGFIDPIYKLKPISKRMVRHEELNDLVDSIQDIAKGFHIPMVVSNQAHRQMTNKGDAPHKDTSYGSDGPVHEADHVIGVKHFSEERRMVLRCTKSRFGSDFRCEVKFYPNIGIMEDITPIRGDYFNSSLESEEEEVAAMIEEMDKEGVK
jgi:hypothetical protein